MEVIVHRGTHQIGGCITEIKSSKGTRIAIDIGANLPNSKGEKRPEIEVGGLTKDTGEPKFKAVIVTHYHGDHIGLYNKLLPNIDLYIGEDSKNIYKILQEHLAKAKMVSKENLELIDKFKTYQIPNRKSNKEDNDILYKITIDDIIITPIEVDHSAFNAHMLLIECDGKKILHTGDFRTHGPRGKAVIPAIKKIAKEVDAIICEGTTLSRKKEKIKTEFELKDEAKEIFKDNKYSFVLSSSTNIDRIAVLHKAAIETNRLFVCDNYQKKILMYINSIAKSDLYKFEGKVLSYDVNILDLMNKMGFVMLVRDNNISRMVMKKFPNSKFIYSQWEGYLDEDFKDYEHLQHFVPKDKKILHTSGHADYESIKKVCEAVKPKVLIPIHSEKPEVFKTMNLEDCQIIDIVDGDAVKI